MSIRERIGGGGGGGDEAAGGEGVMEEGGFEDVGMGLAEFGDGSGHLCDGENWWWWVRKVRRHFVGLN